MGALSIPEKVRRGCYDTGVNQFWIMFLMFTLVFFAALFGWNGDMKKVLNFWPSFIVSFIVLALLVLGSVLMREKEKSKPKPIDKNQSIRAFGENHD